jgi:hypothetical protein
MKLRDLSGVLIALRPAVLAPGIDTGQNKKMQVQLAGLVEAGGKPEAIVDTSKSVRTDEMGASPYSTSRGWRRMPPVQPEIGGELASPESGGNHRSPAPAESNGRDSRQRHRIAQLQPHADPCQPHHHHQQYPAPPPTERQRTRQRLPPAQEPDRPRHQQAMRGQGYWPTPFQHWVHAPFPVLLPLPYSHAGHDGPLWQQPGAWVPSLDGVHSIHYAPPSMGLLPWPLHMGIAGHAAAVRAPTPAHGGAASSTWVGRSRWRSSAGSWPSGLGASRPPLPCGSQKAGASGPGYGAPACVLEAHADPDDSDSGSSRGSEPGSLHGAAIRDRCGPGSPRAASCEGVEV